jgi:ribosomal protein S12 methylthiotransferase accessory factor
MNSLANLQLLVQAHGGLFRTPQRAELGDVEPRLITRIAPLGDLNPLKVSIDALYLNTSSSRTIAASGTDLTDQRALLLALAEGLERYSVNMHTKEQFIWATANELGEDALDLDSIPKCSRAELLDSRCPLRSPSKNEPIRWVRGLSLRDGRTVFIPVVMVYLGAGFVSSAERIALPITTGCAAHISYEAALLHALFEVIERDAISLVWLQKLSLPRIKIDKISSTLLPYWNFCQDSSHNVDYIFFDATRDLCVPTVYTLRIAKQNDKQRTIVSCSTGLNPDSVVAKTIRDTYAMTIALQGSSKVPESWEDFSHVLDGARYMARAEQAEAFDFLLRSSKTQLLSDMATSHDDNTNKALSHVLQSLLQTGREVYAVDLSTDEAIRAGFRVVRALIPSLQPLTFSYRAKYLGHPRLYEAPSLMGYSALSEEQLNRWPQPFG